MEYFEDAIRFCTGGTAWLSEWCVARRAKVRQRGAPFKMAVQFYVMMIRQYGHDGMCKYGQKSYSSYINCLK